jgi:cell division protein FtsB
VASRAARTKKKAVKGKRRQSAGSHRSRYIILGGAVLAAGVLAAWFPASPLLHQRASLASAADQLSLLHRQDAALAQERKNLDSSPEITRIGREQYQLVSPGQQAYEVLPPPGSTSGNTTTAGDPGSTAPVAPSAASVLPVGGVTTTTLAPSPKSAHGTSSSAPATGLVQRMLHALEFWR